jgi:hypothetical protein
MYYMTGMPGWLRFGFSPGWIGRSPTGLPPTAQYLSQTGQVPEFMSYLQQQMPVPPMQPTYPGMPTAPAMPKEQEISMLEQQAKNLETQLEEIKKRMKELK